MCSVTYIHVYVTYCAVGYIIAQFAAFGFHGIFELNSMLSQIHLTVLSQNSAFSVFIQSIVLPTWSLLSKMNALKCRTLGTRRVQTLENTRTIVLLTMCMRAFRRKMASLTREGWN